MKKRIRNFVIILVLIVAVVLMISTVMVSYAYSKAGEGSGIIALNIKPSSSIVEGGSSYFPLQPGNWWIYEKAVHDPDAPDITIKVTGKAKVDGIDCFVYETSIGSKVNRRDYLEQRRGDGIYSRKREIVTPKGIKEFFPQPPDLLLKFPLKTGSSWEWEDSSLKKLKGFNIFEITGHEIVRTEAGDFNSFRLEVYQESTNGEKFKTIRWFAKGVGMVKETTIVGSPFHPMDSAPGATFVLKKYHIVDGGRK